MKIENYFCKEKINTRIKVNYLLSNKLMEEMNTSLWGHLYSKLRKDIYYKILSMKWKKLINNYRIRWGNYLEGNGYMKSIIRKMNKQINHKLFKHLNVKIHNRLYALYVQRDRLKRLIKFVR